MQVWTMSAMRSRQGRPRTPHLWRGSHLARSPHQTRSYLRYLSVYEILLREGLAFEVKARPRDMRAGIANRCYANCHAIAARRGTRYAYCEGITCADFGIPVEHAW